MDSKLVVVVATFSMLCNAAFIADGKTIQCYSCTNSKVDPTDANAIRFGFKRQPHFDDQNCANPTSDKTNQVECNSGCIEIFRDTSRQYGLYIRDCQELFLNLSSPNDFCEWGLIGDISISPGTLVQQRVCHGDLCNSRKHPQIPPGYNLRGTRTVIGQRRRRRQIGECTKSDWFTSGSVSQRDPSPPHERTTSVGNAEYPLNFQQVDYCVQTCQQDVFATNTTTCFSKKEKIELLPMDMNCGELRRNASHSMP